MSIRSTIQPPPPPKSRESKDQELYRWLYEIYRRLQQAGLLDWDALNMDGSSIGDFADKSHTSLDDIGTNTHPQIDLFMASTTAYRATAINTTLAESDTHLKCTAAVTVTLPNSAASISAKEYVIDNASAGNVTVACYLAQTIEGEATQTVPVDSCMVIYSDGANWRIK